MTIETRDQVNTNNFQIFIKTPVGENIVIWVDETEQVIALKMKITKSQVYPVSVQSLIYEGRALQHHRIIKEYSIISGSTIILNLRLRGGGTGDWRKTKKICGEGGGSTSKQNHKNTRPSFKNIL